MGEWPEWRKQETITVVRIVAPHFVAGVIPHNGRVVNAAPILRYMVHWSGRQVADYCAKKGWTWERVSCAAEDAYATEEPGRGIKRART